MADCAVILPLVQIETSLLPREQIHQEDHAIFFDGYEFARRLPPQYAVSHLQAFERSDAFFAAQQNTAGLEEVGQETGE
ncbi:hypothetical protein HRbin36_02653 [bacterium HR36]|nr:hypothetical protein HRbin36_02653 [bacterium HR36]